MRPSRFLDLRKETWDRAEELIRKAQRRGLRSLGESELHELIRVYPALAADVARVRMHGLGERVKRRVNSVAIAAHGLIYRPSRTGYLRAIGRFFARGYPRLFRRLWFYLFLASVVFFAGSASTYVSVRLRPSRAFAFVRGPVDVADTGDGQQLTREDISERFRQMPSPPIAAGVMSNNIQVAIGAFALGILGGIGTAYMLLVNSMMLGGFTAHFANHGLGGHFLAFIAPHGCLEIFAILVAAAAGLRLGASLALPGGLTRTVALRKGSKEAALLMLGTVPMFVLAGLLEGFVTPGYLSQAARVAVGMGALALTLLYLLTAGRRQKDRGGAASGRRAGNSSPSAAYSLRVALMSR